MKREILIRASAQETWVALIEEGQLVEVMFDRADQDRLNGDIYLGRVEAVLPGIQAAFVDIGTEKAGFLHVSDLVADEDEEEEVPSASANGSASNGAGNAPNGNGNGSGNGTPANGNGGGRGRRDRKLPPIQELLNRGDPVLVQVTKEPISTKGPRLTAQISLPGRFLVYMPDSSHIGVSRKIDDREERARLRAIAREIVPPDSGGVIIRTVGEELTREKFEGEFQRLLATWKKIRRRADSSKAPALVHREAKLISGVVRDLFSDKFDRLTVDSPQAYREIVQYVESVDPDLRDRVVLYESPVPLFDHFGIEEEIQRCFQRKVDLPSGGYIIIEPTEALVSIDVNTGRFTGKKGKKDPEETILRTNLDAAREIARQLRIRDVGGIVVCDFIDMESQANRDRVLQEIRTHLGRDRARTRAYAVSELGLIEMTRQRVRPSLFQALTAPCSHCGGSGRIFTSGTMIRQIERSLQRAAAGEERRVQVRLHPEVALHILEQEPDFTRRVSRDTRLELTLRDDPLMAEDQFRLLAGPAEVDVTEKYVPR